MAYIRKTQDIFEIQGNYGSFWEYVKCDETRKEALKSLACCRKNQPQFTFRIKKVRFRSKKVIFRTKKIKQLIT